MEKEVEILSAVKSMLYENARREAEINAIFNPITGEGSVLFKDRVKVVIDDFPIQTQWLPKSMMDVPLVKDLVRAKSIKAFFEKKIAPYYHKQGIDYEYNESERLKIIEQFIRIRGCHDFAFHACLNFYIKQKGGGEDILFRLNRQQRRLVERLERLRLAGKPIRLVLLKARQWGGSTCIQLYMAWLQLTQKVGLNSLIVAHQGTASDEIQDMFDRMINAYPVELLHELGEKYDPNEKKFIGVGKSGNIHRVPQRKFKIKIGTAERPDSARGGDYNLVHCSEVGLWKKTEGKKPSQIVRSACSGILYEPLTMIVYESTANGTGNFFHKEYDAAKNGRSQFEAMFVAWWEIEQYSLKCEDPEALARFLYINRNNEDRRSNREATGQYLWYLWTLGATLDAINWYIIERAKYEDDGDMASEYPSDDIEAFVHSGNMIFDKYKVDKFKSACRDPKYVGDVYADGDEGELAMQNVRFCEDHQGKLWVWAKPEIDPEEKIKDRYLVSVDIGGRGKKSDWSVIVVFDRLFQMEGGKPVVVAQWYGHIDMDLLAWKSAQIAKWYDDALLVIESNTLETHDKDRQVDGDQSNYILNLVRKVYDNLYARKQSDEEIQNHEPKKYGFHTNIATKPKIVSNLVKVIRESLYVERDERCLNEYLTYEQKPNGAYGAIQGMHDDLLMSRGIGLLIAFTEMPLPEVVTNHSAGMALKKRSVSEAVIN